MSKKISSAERGLLRYLKRSPRIDLKVIEEFLDQGADVDVRDEIGRTPLSYSLTVGRRGHRELAALLLRKGADVDCQEGPEGPTPLLRALSSGQWGMVELLLKGGADPHSRWKEEGDLNALGVLAQRITEPERTSDEIRRFAQLGVDPNHVSALGATPLLVACSRDLDEPRLSEAKVAVTQALLEVGAQPDHRDAHGWSARMYAVYAGATEMEAVLEGAGASSEGTEVAGLFREIEEGDDATALEVVSVLDDLDWIGPQGESALTRAILLERDAVVEELLRRGADVNLLGPSQYTPLTAAISNGKTALVGRLLEAGADPNLEGAYQTAPLGFAAGRPEIEKLLRAYGARERTHSEDRGISSQDANNRLLLVKARIDNVSRALASVLVDASVTPDVHRKKVTAREESFLVVQLVGHEWCQVHPLCSSGWGPALARALSERLEGLVVFHECADTAGYYGYELYEGGRGIEGVFWGEESDSFLSRSLEDEGLEVEPDAAAIFATYSERGFPYDLDRSKDPMLVVDDFLIAEGAFIPPWMDSDLRVKPGKSKSVLSTVKKIHFERIDFVSGTAISVG